ncbi:hypothetical protein Mal4_35470 [Maioricimonas rarisocia]|uniref:Uncharacterized protein n=1 Tax=Maioricimonas rarisocia TaxID=2528026 RepID=A0A517Z9U7_9PLAN|nr:hypothetical protein [Maioricimonas rarisocia]QDU39210.1 hypothetical protein Mal4_35470 [Maioricimonas rarisocia]
MIYELVYTSAPSGLRPGSSGYCTVQSSRGIAAPTVDLLESLSGYRHVFTPGTPEASRNPVNFGHYLLRISGRTEHVLSRVSDCELDYSGRSNKLAHHVVIDSFDQVPAGPAWLLGYDGWMVDRWDGTVCYLETPRQPPEETPPQSPCFAWKKATGDAGWGGVLAEAFLANPKRKAFLIYEPGTDVLALFDEAISLLPRDRRWDVTFATFGAALPATVDCAWTGLVAGSKDVQLSRRFVDALRIDLTAPLEPATEGRLVEMARTGGPAPPPSRSDVPAAATVADPPPEPEVGPVGLAQNGDDEPILLRPRRSRRPAPPPLERRPVRQKSRVPWFLVGVAAACLIVGLATTWFVVSQLAPQLEQVAAVDAEPTGNDADDTPDDAGASEVRTSKEPKLPDGSSETENRERPRTDRESDAAESANEPAAGDASEEASKAGTVVAAETMPAEEAAQESDETPAMSKPEPEPDQTAEEEPTVPEVIYALKPTDVTSDEPQILKLPEGWDRGLGEIQEVRVLLPATEKEGVWGAFQIQRELKEGSKSIEFVIRDEDDTFSGQDDTSKKYYPIARLLIDFRTAEVGYVARAQFPTPRQDSLLTNLAIKVKGASSTRVIALRPRRPLVLARKETVEGIRFFLAGGDVAPKVGGALKSVRCHIGPLTVSLGSSIVALEPRGRTSNDEADFVEMKTTTDPPRSAVRIIDAKCAINSDLTVFRIDLAINPSPNTVSLRNLAAEQTRLALKEFWEAYKQIVPHETRQTLALPNVDERASDAEFQSALETFAEAFRKKYASQRRGSSSQEVPRHDDPPILKRYMEGRKELRRLRLESQRWRKAVDSMQVTSGRLFYRVYDPSDKQHGEKAPRTWEIDFLRIGSDDDEQTAP